MPSLPPSQSRPLVSWITCAEGEAKACESCSNRISQSTSTRQNHISTGHPWFCCPCDPGDCPGVASGIQQKFLAPSHWERLPAKAALMSWSSVAVLGSRRLLLLLLSQGKGYIYPCPHQFMLGTHPRHFPPAPATAAGLGGPHVASSTLKAAGSCRKNLSQDMKMKWYICIKACSEEGSQSTQGQG